MNREEATNTLKSDFIGSLNGLLTHYTGEPPIFFEVEPSVVSAACAGTIGFSHEHMIGSAILLISHSDCIARLGAPEGCDDSDWVGELANQLLGRFKNKVVAYGPLIDMALPSVICGKDLRHGGEGHVAHWQAHWHGFDISAVLNLEIRDGLTLNLESSDEVAEEGTLCFF
jgi:hypothetical protein